MTMLAPIWPSDDINVARKLVEIAVLHVALEVAVVVLRHHHPMLDDDYRPADPDDLLVARRLVSAALELRGLLECSTLTWSTRRSAPRPDKPSRR